jgi:hypothetical protein
MPATWSGAGERSQDQCGQKLYQTDPRGESARQALCEMEVLVACPTSQRTPITKGGIRMPRITELIVTKDGQTTIQTRGFNGNTCISASKWLEQALGITTDDRKTTEFFETASTEQLVRQE